VAGGWADDMGARARPGPADDQNPRTQRTARLKSRSAHRRERGMVQALSEGHWSVALRYRVLLAVVTAVPLALVATCGGGNPGSGNAAGLPSALSGPGAGIPSAPAPGPQTLSETGSTLGIIVAALLMALGGAWGLSVRLAEYR